MPKKILIVDDEPLIVKGLKYSLEQDNYEIDSAQDGEEAFRLGEERALRHLSERKSLLVSCGGGIVERAACCELMHEMGTVVYLDGSLDDSMRQIQHPERRPDLGTAEQAKELYLHRRPLYQKTADITIDIREKTFEQVAAEAGSLLWERGLL